MTRMNALRSAALSAFAAALLCASVSAQEAIHSFADLRYDFLALNGEIGRPYLNYKTLSDSTWENAEGWRTYGPELFLSYNSALPQGANDGALWQGRGGNARLTAGLRFEGGGFELTLRPELLASQNLSFALMPSAYPSEYGYIWGYGPGIGADAPQQFGDDPLVEGSWGDTELRYTWRGATIGLGFQSPWLGPGRVNAIMHSNNAGPYPKADIGLRRRPVTLFGWYAGDVEARLWAGYLSESEHFDENEENDHNLISALAVAYAPSFLPGLSLFANRSYLAPWDAESLGSIPRLFFINLRKGGAQDDWDQRASFGFDYLLPEAGVEVYGEAGLNDYGPSLDGYIRYPFHSMVYTWGLRKAVHIGGDSFCRGEILLEVTNMELSQDFQFQWPATFYMHHQVVQGYTNEGQWLGAGIGTGGNSQYLSIRGYATNGVFEIYIQRSNPDNDFLYRETILKDGSTSTRIEDFRADLSIGVRMSRPLDERCNLACGFAITQVHNPLYDGIDWERTDKTYNARAELAISRDL